MLPAPPQPFVPRSGTALLPVEGPAVRVRLAVSPLYTVLASLFEVVGGWRRGTDERWVSGVLARTSDVDLSAFALFADEERVVPHLLSPCPREPAMTWEDELAAVAGASPEAVRDELLSLRADPSAPAVAAWVRDPMGAHGAYVAALDAWWRAAVAPQWPQMQALVEAEVLRLARAMAVEGRGAALAALHPRIGWDGRQLRLPTDDPIGDGLASRELVLLPLACGSEGVITALDHPDTVLIAYAAPGTASLFGPVPEPAPDPLAEALGASRAVVLRALDGVHGVRALAAAVGLAPSTVHAHLGALQRAELVHRVKVGPEVRYTATPRGRRLVELFGGHI